MDFAKNDKEQLQQSLKLTEEQHTKLNAKLEVCYARFFKKNRSNVLHFRQVEESFRDE